MTDLTRILSSLKGENPAASEELLPLVYSELRKLAALKLLHEKPGFTLVPTALVHEAYLRLVNQDAPPQWDNRGHFFAAAAEAMRRILVEIARKKKSRKHGGSFTRVDFEEIHPESSDSSCEFAAEEILALDEALATFEKSWPKEAKLVELRYFGGMTNAEAADELKINPSTADRWWAFAKAWLKSELTKPGNS